MRSTIAHPTPIDRLWPTAVVLAGSALLTLAAKIQVPFYPVPMTMVTAVVFLLGLALGPAMAVATVATYLLEGALGLPVFSGTPERGIGLAYMAGPTGGYLLGFLFAAAICGLAARRGLRRLALASAILLATLAIYLPGALWLSAFVGAKSAWAVGIAPFLLGDALKLAVVVLLAEAGLSRLTAGGR